MNCPNCGANNDDRSRFCLRCGQALGNGGAGPQPGAPAPMPAPPPAQQAPQAPYYPPQPPGAQTVYTPPPAYPAQPPAAPAGYGQQPGYPPPTPMNPPQGAYPQQLPPAPYPGQGGLARPKFGASKASGFNIWGPFAGYGTRRKHNSWLLDGQGARARDLIDKVRAKFSERQIPEAMVSQQTLTARGVAIESRPYFIIRRGLVSQALYIREFGKDLYISQASYLKPPISNFKVLLLAGMIAFWLFTTFLFPVLLSDSIDSMFGGGLFGLGGGGGGGGLLVLACLIAPLGSINSLALFLLLIYSCYKWLTEKDFLAGLRETPNEFNEDDLMAMQKAVEQTVRISLDEIGLNPNELKPIDLGQNLRII